MITQAIKRWLQNLFAWWPWKTTPETSYVHTPTSYKSTTQESTLRTTVEGSITQPGVSSVAVEHSEEDMLTDLSWSMLDERPERNLPPPPPIAEESSDKPRTPSKEQEKDKQDTSEEETPAPTTAQKLEFLRYLVQKGHVNEGFSKGKEPEQYRNK